MSVALATPAASVLDLFPSETASTTPSLATVLERSGYPAMTRSVVRAHMDQEYHKALASSSGLARLFANRPGLLNGAAWFCCLMPPVAYFAALVTAFLTALEASFGILDPGPVSWVVLGVLAVLILGGTATLFNAGYAILDYASLEIESVMWRRIRVDMHSPLPWYAKRAIVRLDDEAKKSRGRMEFYLHTLGNDPFLEAVFRSEDNSRQAEFILGYDHDQDLNWYKLVEDNGRIISQPMRIEQPRLG